MPLRNHFGPPLDERSGWEELHGQWPAVIVQQLRGRLPHGYVAGPRVHVGSAMEIDVATFERDDAVERVGTRSATGGWSPAIAGFVLETEPPEEVAYEVRIYDAERGRRLVAAIEIVSPANKDRPEHRNAFVAKCAELLRQGVAVSIVDLVVIRRVNLYSSLLDFLGHDDPNLPDPAPSIYATSCRWVAEGRRARFEVWNDPLEIGRPLPTLPIWLSADTAIPLDLEESYEKACSDLWIA